MSSDRELLFGTDLALTGAAGGLDLRATPVGDLALAAGSANIVQALTLRLMVRKGELAPLGWPDFGSRLHELIGEPNNQRTRVKLMGLARAAIGPMHASSRCWRWRHGCCRASATPSVSRWRSSSFTTTVRSTSSST
jgi:hypothetical protein